MNLNDVMESMINHNKEMSNSGRKKKDYNKNDKHDKRNNNRISKPIDVLDPVNDKMKQTLIKVCAYIEWLTNEVHELREEIGVKIDIAEYNNLSIKLFQIIHIFY